MRPPEKIEGVVVSLDHHFGTPRALDDRVVGLDLTPAARQGLSRLAQSRVRLALLVDRLDEDRDAYGTPSVDISTVIGRGGDLKRALQEAGRRLGINRGVFVSVDRADRGSAVEAGWRAVPHVSVAAAWMDGHAIRFARLSGGDLSQIGWIIPYSLERTHEGWTVLGLVADATIATACTLGFQIEALDVDPQTEDVLQVHLDAADDTIIGELAKHRIVRSDGRRVWLALGARQHIEDVALHGRHGHFVLLGPRPELFAGPPLSDYRIHEATARVPRKHLSIVKATEVDVSRLYRHVCQATASTFQADVDRYRGTAPLDDVGPVVSRHVRHPDNVRVVQALLKDLRDIGYCAYTHAFAYDGSTKHSVIADLPGRGRLVCLSDLLDRLRKVLSDHPWPRKGWLKQLDDLLGTEWRTDWRLVDADDRRVRIALERAVGLAPWWPWWRLCKAPGFGAEIVLVGCHLDSTASFDSGYDPAADPAPGADDDASGIAAVLAAARHLWEFREELTHTVRFAFFNAEEVGRVGSGAYASKMKNDGAPVKAVICADMVGFNSDAQKIFEIHAGYSDPVVRDKSVPIASLVKNTAAARGNLGDGQIYQGTSWPPPGNADRALYDGAIDRSDHASFHAQGYGAIVVSEDFFLNLPAEPASDPNPNYHRASDTTVDPSYGAEIACVIAATARALAT